MRLRRSNGNDLGHETGAGGDFFKWKNGGKKYHETVPLTVIWTDHAVFWVFPRYHCFRQRTALRVCLTLVKLSKTVKASLTGVGDAGEEFLTGVNGTATQTLPVSLTSAKHRNYWITYEYSKNIEILSRLIHRGQEEQSAKKPGGDKSRDTVPLRSWHKRITGTEYCTYLCTCNLYLIQM